MILTYLIITCIITYSFELVFGLAGTILLMPVATLLYDVKTIVIFSLLPQVCTSLVAISTSHKSINWKQMTQLFLFAFIGAMIGTYVFDYISSYYLKKILAVAIIFSGFFMLLKPEIKLPYFLQKVFEFLAGFMHALIGISGPIVAIRLAGTIADKTQIRTQMLTLFLFVNIFRGISYMASKAITIEIIKMWIIAAPIFLISFYFTNRLHYKVNDKYFKKIVTFVIIISGFILLK